MIIMLDKFLNHVLYFLFNRLDARVVYSTIYHGTQEVTLTWHVMSDLRSITPVQDNYLSAQCIDP